MSPSRNVAIPSTRRRAPDSLRDDMHGSGAGRGGAELEPAVFDPATVGGEGTDRLEGLEAVIAAAQEQADRTVRQARDAFILKAGPALRAIRDEEGHKWVKDDAGQWVKDEERTFEGYVRERWGYSRPYAYQIMEAVPVVAALSAIADSSKDKINAEHVKQLAPVVRQHGEDAARRMWEKAKTDRGKVTGAALRAAATELGFVTTGIPVQQQAEPAPPTAKPEPSPLALLGQAANHLKAARRALSRQVVTDSVEQNADLAEQLMEEIRDKTSSISRLISR